MSDPRIVGESLRRFVGGVSRRLVLNLHEGISGATPVDTGWARTNWVPQVGSAFEGTAGTRPDAEAGNLDRGPAEAGIAEVRRYEVEQGDIHVTNNVPYIELLNGGSSSQAPSAFVQKEIVSAIESTIRGIRGDS